MISGGLIGGGEAPGTPAPTAAPPPPGASGGAGGSTWAVHGLDLSKLKPDTQEALAGKIGANLDANTSALNFSQWTGLFGQFSGLLKDIASWALAKYHFDMQNNLINKRAAVENHVLDNQKILGEKALEFAEASDERRNGANGMEARVEQIRANAAVRMKEMELASQERITMLGDGGALDREMFGRGSYPNGSPVGLG